MNIEISQTNIKPIKVKNDEAPLAPYIYMVKNFKSLPRKNSMSQLIALNKKQSLNEKNHLEHSEKKAFTKISNIGDKSLLNYKKQ